MKQLRQYIRQTLLAEAMKLPSDLPDSAYVIIDDSGNGRYFEVIIEDPDTPILAGFGATKLASLQVSKAPAGYCDGAWQNIVPVEKTDRPGQIEACFDVVGPVCESGDFLGKGRLLKLKEGDLLAVRSAGAYGFVMGSNYNTRGRAAEILVDKSQTHVIRERESLESLWALEKLVDESS